MVSTQGLGARIRPELDETTKSGRRYARPKEGDEIAVVTPCNGEVVTIATAGGYVSSFPTHELPELTGAGRGVWAIRVAPGDRVVGAVCHPPDAPPIAIAESGEVRRLQVADLGRRGQKGRPTLKRFKPATLIARTAELPSHSEPLQQETLPATKQEQNGGTKS
jgi:DNA gyrase/topoisomerase IV subunit A